MTLLYLFSYFIASAAATPIPGATSSSGYPAPSLYTVIGAVLAAIIAGGFALLQSKSKNKKDKFDSFMQESEKYRKELRDELERQEKRSEEEIDKLKVQVKDQEIQIKVLEEKQTLDSKFKILIDHLPQIVWTAKPDGNVDYYNARAYQFGGRPFSAGKDLGWTKIFHPDDLERGLEIWRNSVMTGEPYYYVYRIRRSDGIYRWHLGTALPRMNEHGQILQWVGSCTDIHDLRERLIDETLQDVENSKKELDNSAE